MRGSQEIYICCLISVLSCATLLWELLTSQIVPHYGQWQRLI